MKRNERLSRSLATTEIARVGGHYAVQSRSRSLIFVPVNFVVKDPIKPTIALALRLLFLLHSPTYKTYNLKFHVNIFLTIFANLPPPSKCRLVRPATPHPPRYSCGHRQQAQRQQRQRGSRLNTAASYPAISF